MKLNKEVAQEIREILERPELEDYVWDKLIGVRFDKVSCEVGSILPESKAFFPTEDSDVRDFPEYNSEEYEELPGMGGTSTWSIEEILRLLDKNPDGHELKDTHCHVVIAESYAMPDVMDDGERVLIDPVVIAKLS